MLLSSAVHPHLLSELVRRLAAPPAGLSTVRDLMAVQDLDWLAAVTGVGREVFEEVGVVPGPEGLRPDEVVLVVGAGAEGGLPEVPGRGHDQAQLRGGREAAEEDQDRRRRAW